MNHIRDKLPDMKARLNTLMGQAQQELNSFGDEAIYGDTNQARPSYPTSSFFLSNRIAVSHSKAHSFSGS
jgi:hypothetical protein